MNLLRIYVVVLMVGWFVWLALDKSPPASFGPGPVAPPGINQPYALPLPERPTPHPVPLPPREGDMLADFQYAVDMLKRGEVRQGFVVLWRRQYFWAAAVISAAVIIVLAPAVRAVFRRRPRAGRRGAGSGDPRRRLRDGDA